MKLYKKLYNCKLTPANDREVDVDLPRESWEPREYFRVCLMNPAQDDPTIAIALPHGADFRLAYRWCFHYEVRGVGPSKVEMKMHQLPIYSKRISKKQLAYVIWRVGRILWADYLASKTDDEILA